MSNRLADWRCTALEEQIRTEAESIFAEYLKQCPVNGEAVQRLERNLLQLALAGKMAASMPPASVIHDEAGIPWHTGVDLMTNILLCYRPTAGRTEYAVVEHFQANATNEIWNRGWDAVQVLRIFAEEQRRALEFGIDDMVARTRELLAEKYSDQDLSFLIDSFERQFQAGTSAEHERISEQNQIVDSIPASWSLK